MYTVTLGDIERPLPNIVPIKVNREQWRDFGEIGDASRVLGRYFATIADKLLESYTVFGLSTRALSSLAYK